MADTVVSFVIVARTGKIAQAEAAVYGDPQPSGSSARYATTPSGLRGALLNDKPVAQDVSAGSELLDDLC
jgi:hypothetical protein